MFGPKVILQLQSRANTTEDNFGGFTDAWVTIPGAALKGALSTLTGAERTRPGDKDTVVSSHRFFCNYPKNLSIKESHRFKLSHNIGDTRYFNIVYVNNPGLRDIFLFIDLLEITKI